MTRREFVAFVRAQRRYMNSLLADVLRGGVGDDSSEYAKGSADALALMVRVLVEDTAPYNLDQVLIALLHLYPGEALCDELRDLPHFAGHQDRDLDRDYLRVELKVDEVCVAPLIAPFRLFLRHEEALHIVRQLQTQIDAHVAKRGPFSATSYQITPLSDEDHAAVMETIKAGKASWPKT
ncbi:hypothetical protein CHELA1G11_40074 [Hyphomicrobiales bacterium]|nr:hypothetical protein CHELA1G2_40067 [Hyphomicrobiales bacterium]CAH1696477.1 hypothetical protein CHELA1G11_40074 [Hyphomicrobiales bacterium]